MSSSGQVVPCPISARAAVSPHDTCIVHDGHEMSFAEFDRAVASVVGELRKRGIQHGDRVAFQLPNSVEALALFWACFRIRAVACPISTRMPPNIVRTTVNLVAAKYSGDTINLSSPPRPAMSDNTVDVHTDATVIFSSGSTGRPKAIVHSLDAHVSSAYASNHNIKLKPGDRWLLSLPVFHVGGLAIVFRCALAGASVVIESNSADLAHQIKLRRVSHVSLVSTQLKRILTSDARALLPLSTVLLGGSAMPRSLIRKSLAEGVRLRTTYGMTEMASQVTTTTAETTGKSVYSSGKPIGKNELAIAVDGEILVRGPSLLKGYLVDGKIKSAIDADGWFHTNDRGFVDAGGYLTVTGRIDNMFISGGENIFPEEIESVLMEIPGVTQAIVVPVPNEEFGQRPVAFIDGSTPVSQIGTFLARRLPKYKIPDRFLPWPNEDRQSGMKPNRQRLAKYANKTKA